MDGDGDLDVLSASSNYNYRGGKIAWYENDGAGRFSSPQVITTQAHGAKCVYAADLDGDGDPDVLSASWLSWGERDKIAWYENDRTLQFGPQRVITTEADGAASVHAADLDGDGDLDVLSASSNDKKIAWYENDGAGQFGPPQVISNPVSATSVWAADLDGDRDFDVLSASYGPTWYENDGSGRFGLPKVISNSFVAHSVCAADLDVDGDMDVLVSCGWGIAWYENDGTGHFNDRTDQLGTQTIIETLTEDEEWLRSVHAADLDGDGDLDILSASSSYHSYDGKITWYENDGAGQFGSQQVITTEANGATAVYAADLDSDGDLDVLSASRGDNKIAWYENEGSGRFASRRVIYAEVNGARSVYAADLDGDGDLDVLSASSNDDKIAWYENE